MHDFSLDELRAYLKFRFLEKYGDLLQPPTHQDLANIFGNDLTTGNFHIIRRWLRKPRLFKSNA
jgi:hypothetical protein